MPNAEDAELDWPADFEWESAGWGGDEPPYSTAVKPYLEMHLCRVLVDSERTPQGVPALSLRLPARLSACLPVCLPAMAD